MRRQVGIVQRTEIGYPKAEPGLEFELYEDFGKESEKDLGWHAIKVTKGQQAYCMRLSPEKRASYVASKLGDSINRI